MKTDQLLARQIGFNRVIAGLHFRSDIAAGADAAEKTHNFLKGMPVPTSPPVPPHFNYDTVDRMWLQRAEWN